MTYKDIVDSCTVKPKRLHNAIVSFISGGVVGAIADILANIFSADIMLVIIISVSSLLTGLGVFDKCVSKFKMGLVIPISGFANSITSTCIDYKYEGLITGIGSNVFKLAGSVILYGIVSVFVLALIRGVLCLL